MLLCSMERNNLSCRSVESREDRAGWVETWRMFLTDGLIC